MRENNSNSYKQLSFIGFGVTIVFLIVVGVIAFKNASQLEASIISVGFLALLIFLIFISLLLKKSMLLHAENGIHTCEPSILENKVDKTVDKIKTQPNPFEATDCEEEEEELQIAERDIAEYKQIELRLRQKNAELIIAKMAAEKANLAKSDFLSSMSHELRTPLNAILGFAQLMDTAKPDPTPEQKLSIDQILRAGWHLLSLINEILDLALIESGKVTMSNEAVSLKLVLQDCLSMLTPKAEKRNVKITFPTLDCSQYVYADQTRLKQVMINLLVNAIKYNRDGGEVIVEYEIVDQQRARVSVHDTGVGLKQEKVDQLFEPFNRLDQEGGSQEGTGIGLVVTKKLVELMNGSIGVISKFGVGTTFWFELPLSSKPKLALDDEIDADNIDNIDNADSNKEDKLTKANEIAASTNFPIKQYTLLYVEDNPANVRLIEQLIKRRSDLKLITAVDAHFGIQLARIYKPDVIITDINLPGLNGFVVLRILRNDPLTAHIPIMALSANVSPRDVEKGMDAGFFRYLTKPIKVPEFMEAIDAVLRQIKEKENAFFKGKV